MTFDFIPKKKNILICILIVVLLAAGSVAYIVFKINKSKAVPVSEEKIMEDILKSLTAPEKEEPLSAKEIENLKNMTAPEKKTQPVSEDILKSLTAPK